MFLKVKGGKFNHPIQGRGSTCRFGACSEGGQRVRSINRITSDWPSIIWPCRWRRWPYLSLTTSRFVVLLPSTYDNRLIKYLHINLIFKKGMFLKVKGGKFNRPVQGRGSTCRFSARSEGGQWVRSINRITSQGSHRYSRGGTTPLCYNIQSAVLKIGGAGGSAVKLTTDLLQLLCLWGRLLAACDKKKSASLKEQDAEEVPLQTSAMKEKPLDEKPQAAVMNGGDKSSSETPVMTVHPTDGSDIPVHSGQGEGQAKPDAWTEHVVEVPYFKSVLGKEGDGWNPMLEQSMSWRFPCSGHVEFLWGWGGGGGGTWWKLAYIFHCSTEQKRACSCWWSWGGGGGGGAGLTRGQCRYYLSVQWNLTEDPFHQRWDHPVRDRPLGWE